MYSIILTIHNKEFLIARVLDSIIKYTAPPYELICIWDGCIDKSFEIGNKILQNSDIIHKHLFADNIFETRANNMGLERAQSKYSIIIQDDMVIKEEKYNTRMAEPCEKWSDIFAVTARTAHNWEFNPNTKHLYEKEDRDDAWSDIVFHTEHADKNNTPRNIFRIRDSINRGPLLLKTEVVRELGYLDKEIEKQDMDDHCLMYKAYKELGMKSGLYWIDFESQNEWGGTRDNLGQTKSWFLKANQHNAKLFYRKYKDMIGHHHNEDRILEC